MKILSSASAGTAESGDVFVVVSAEDDLNVQVQTQWDSMYDSLKERVEAYLKDIGLEEGYVSVTDHGALNCTLEARLKAAVARGMQEESEVESRVETAKRESLTMSSKAAKAERAGENK